MPVLVRILGKIFMKGVLEGGVGAVICFKNILDVKIGFRLSNNFP